LGGFVKDNETLPAGTITTRTNGPIPYDGPASARWSYVEANELINRIDAAHGAANDLRDHAAGWVNVLSYPGADPTGVADSRAAIQAADAAAAAAKVPLHFPGGVFRYVATGSTYTATAPAWIGAGQGNTYDSNDEGGTILKIEGANGGLPVLKPPQDFQGFHLDGVDQAATGIALGQDGSFTGFHRWRNLTLRRFNRAIDAFNFYSVVWDNITVQGNHEGVRIAPTNGAGDDGYFTATAWRNVHIADNDVYGLYVNTPLGTKTWTWENVVIERNGAAGTYQAFLINAGFSGNGVYFEGTSTVPALKLDTAKASILNGYFGGTGGIDGANSPAHISLRRTAMSSATDVIANLPSTAVIEIRDSDIQTDLRANTTARLVLYNTSIAGVGVINSHVGSLSIGSRNDGLTATPIFRVLSWATTVSGTVPANGSLQVITNKAYSGIWSTGDNTHAFANLNEGSSVVPHPGLYAQVTTAGTTGNTAYFSVFLVNTTASPVTLTDALITVLFFKTTAAAI
jgi:hypothetical protein